MSDPKKPVLKLVSISTIRPNPVALRQVDKQSADYIGIREGMRERGFHEAITVREMTDKETNVPYLQLTNGLHRFTAAAELGIEMIPVSIMNESDEEAMLTQIVMNLHRVETKSTEYAKQLLQYLELKPTVTEVELAKKLGHTVQWLRDRLGLAKITDPTILGLIKDGKICMGNATALARLPATEQAAMLDAAMTEASDVFSAAVRARSKEVRDAIKQGREIKPPEFVAVQVFRKGAEVKDEKAVLAAGTALIKSLKITDPVQAFAMAVKWVLNSDPVTLAARKKEFEDREAAATAAKAKASAEREAKKAAKLEEDAKKTQAAATEARAKAELAAKGQGGAVDATAAPAVDGAKAPAAASKIV